MNNDSVIHFNNVSKRFVFTPDSPRSIQEFLVTIFSRRLGRRPKQELWAVEGVSFDIYPGQSLGIIGRNGSGKSTILKLITRILRPTSGRIVVRGRTSALLELGAGFHLDLTGRENIYLNASVLGLSRKAIGECFDDIVAFSELGKYIDMPVKHYSSGMFMRLGFSVAIHVNPDILIVDEILAVGDQAFQEKCIDHIYQMKKNGTTIVIVSHDLNMVRHLCSRLIWIENGVIQNIGRSDDIAEQYNNYSSGKEIDQHHASEKTASFNRQGSREIEITSVRFLDGNGNERRAFNTHDKMIVEMKYFAHEPVPNPEFGLAIFRHDGIHINGPNTQLAGLEMGEVLGPGVVRYKIERLPLLPGRYLVTAAVHDSRFALAYDYHEEAYSFRVTTGGAAEIHGLFEIPATWEWETIKDNGVIDESLPKTPEKTI